MRLWSIHPKYLDAKGIVALWREGLLAQKVLQGKTKGYKNHPQLERFKTEPDALAAISLYLKYVWEKSKQREYSFNRDKIYKYNIKKKIKIKVTKKQIQFEYEHLNKKLKMRDPQQYAKNSLVNRVLPHPLFSIVTGEIEPWEKI